MSREKKKKRQSFFLSFSYSLFLSLVNCLYDNVTIVRDVISMFMKVITIVKRERERKGERFYKSIFRKKVKRNEKIFQLTNEERTSNKDHFSHLFVFFIDLYQYRIIFITFSIHVSMENVIMLQL